MSRRPIYLVLLLLVGLSGCGPGSGLTLAPVSGSVHYMGEPVRFGYITFMPDASQGTQGPPATSIIGPDGTFVLSTEKASDGAIVGTHKVAILGLDLEPISVQAMPDPQANPQEFFTAKAQMGRSTAAKKDDFPTYVGREGNTYRIVVPERFRDPEASGITLNVERGWGSNRFKIMIEEDGTVTVE